MKKPKSLTVRRLEALQLAYETLDSTMKSLLHYGQISLLRHPHDVDAIHQTLNAVKSVLKP